MKESYQMGFVNMEGRWPSDEQCAGYQETAERFQQECFQLARRLLAAFARGLGLAPDFFEEVLVDLFPLQLLCMPAHSNFDPFDPFIPAGVQAWVFAFGFFLSFTQI